MGKIIIHYLSYCPHSIKALQTLKSIENINLDEFQHDTNKDETKQKFIKLYNHSTFPLILYKSYKTKNIYYIGGNDKLQEIMKEINIKSKISIDEIPKYIASYNDRTEGEQRFICYILVSKNLI